jgi:shikimate kinase
MTGKSIETGPRELVCATGHPVFTSAIRSGVPRPVVLVGLMGSGKSTVGPPLAERLGVPFVDNDVTLLRRTGHSARDIEQSRGFDALHRAEADVLLAVLEAGDPVVVAAAAGAVLEPDVARELRDHIVVYLRALPEALAQRVVDDDGHRPFAGRDATDVLREQFDARDDVYRSLASLVVDATAPVNDIVETISAAVAP